jgi:hypothetical protein
VQLPPQVTSSAFAFISLQAALLTALRQKSGARYPQDQLCVPNKVLCKRGASPLAVVAGHMQYRLTTQVRLYLYTDSTQVAAAGLKLRVVVAPERGVSWALVRPSVEHHDGSLRCAMTLAGSPVAERPARQHNHSLPHVPARPSQAASVVLLLVGEYVVMQQGCFMLQVCCAG